SGATNRGIAEARFPDIKLVDADDVLLPDATSLLLAAFRKHQGTVLAYGRTEFYAAQQEALDRRTATPASPGSAARLEPQPPASRALRGFGSGPSNSLIVAAAAGAVGGCDPRVFTQYYSLVLRLAAAGPFVAIDDVVALCPAVAEGRVNDGGPQI